MFMLGLTFQYLVGCDLQEWCPGSEPKQWICTIHDNIQEHNVAYKGTMVRVSLRCSKLCLTHITPGTQTVLCNSDSPLSMMWRFCSPASSRVSPQQYGLLNWTTKEVKDYYSYNAACFVQMGLHSVGRLLYHPFQCYPGKLQGAHRCPKQWLKVS